ncbi:MAG: HEAT repeat domain-containing protein [Anaerolineae bacterium]
MLDSLIQQLESGDAEKRRQAIIALGRTKDMAALPALAKVYREDADPELRELARKAGVYIRQQNEKSDEAAGHAPSTPSAPQKVKLDVYQTPSAEDLKQKSPSSIPSRGREYDVSPDKRKRAKEYIEGALGANMRGDNARAMKDLAQGLALDPNLINDSYFASIAASVTGVAGDEAVRMIVDSQQRKQFVDTQVQRVKQDVRDKQLAKAKESNVGGVGFELALNIGINFLFPILLAIVITSVLQNLFAANRAALDESLAQYPNMVDLDAINRALYMPLPLLLVIGITSAVGVIFSTLLQSVFIHMVAKLMGAVGTYLHLLDVLLQFYNRFYPILYSLIGAFFILASATIGSPLIACLSIILVLFMLYFSFKTASKVGEAYNMGAGMGCVAVLVAGILIFVLNGLISAVFGGTVNSLLTNAIANVVIPPTATPTLAP